MRDRLAAYGGLLAEHDGRPVGALVFEPDGDTVFLRRFGVVPAAQGRGVAARPGPGRAADRAGARAPTEVAVVAREELPETIRFWEVQGFDLAARDSPYVELRRPLGSTRIGEVDAPDAEAMRRLGAARGAPAAGR